MGFGASGMCFIILNRLVNKNYIKKYSGILLSG
jgi:hypothetical protein